MMRQPGVSNRIEIFAQAAIFGLAALLLFWALTEKYLWQDEAATAVLAVRMLKFGRPMAYDGKNLLTIDMQDEEEDAELSKRTKEPQAAIDFYVAEGNFKKDTTWKWQPWGLFAIAAAGIKLLGQTTLGARLPFALAGLATVPLLYYLVRTAIRQLSGSGALRHAAGGATVTGFCTRASAATIRCRASFWCSRCGRSRAGNGAGAVPRHSSR